MLFYVFDAFIKWTLWKKIYLNINFVYFITVELSWGEVKPQVEGKCNNLLKLSSVCYKRGYKMIEQNF